MNSLLPKDLKQQLDIFLEKSESERFAIGDAFMEFGQQLLEQSIRESHPGITKTDLALEVFRRRYGSEFSPEELEKILDSMTSFHEKESPDDR